MRHLRLPLSVMFCIGALAACDAPMRGDQGPSATDGVNAGTPDPNNPDTPGNDGRNPNGGGPIPNCDPAASTGNSDQDGDGYTPMQGDCNDCDPLINPGASNIVGDMIDYACSGHPGVVASCTPITGQGSAGMALAQAMDLCDPRFVKGVSFKGPSDSRARAVVNKFGIVAPHSGVSMALISSGLAEDASSGYRPQDQALISSKNNLGFANTAANPIPNLVSANTCGPKNPPDVFDYTEVVVNLKTPTNASSFSFDFHFFSAEYPEFLCVEYNDEFLVLQESKSEFGGQITNIAYDMHMDPITVNSGFFTVCQNDPGTPHANNCTAPVSQIAGTGYDVKASGIPVGGSTGWLTTTGPVSPGEDVTLHFVIFDEGDHILDSAALVDNFRWSLKKTSAPVTNPDPG